MAAAEDSGPVFVDGVVASACGKVLLTGGYLILEKEYSGLVVAVNALFHSRIFGPLKSSLVPRNISEDVQNLKTPGVIFLSTPQRSTKTSAYQVSFLDDKQQFLQTFSLTCLSPDCEPNKFAEVTILTTLMILSIICEQV